MQITGLNISIIYIESCITDQIIKQNKMIRNFLFHRVSDKRDRLWDPMDTALFDKCIQYISNKYEVVLLEDLVFSDNLFAKKNTPQ